MFRPLDILMVVALPLLAATIMAAQTPAQAAHVAHDWRLHHQPEIINGFEQLLAIRNVAADPAHLEQNARTLVAMLQQRHVATQLLSLPGAPPVVFGEINTPNAKHTIIFYAHYDGQPVTPSEWKGGDPFHPVLREVNGEQRIYARSAADDKAAIYAQLMALDALEAASTPLNANIRFLWEGEEEAGSPHLEKILSSHRDLVRSDLLLVCDGPVDQTGQQTVVFGARGDAHLEITIYGPHHGLHSGHYGNWAPNPAMMLAQLLAGMEDAQGHVLIPHFYDGIAPLSAREKRAIADAPRNDEMLRRELWLGHVDGGGKRLLDLLNQPSLNINGISSGHTGASATNMIPPTATVDLDMRLVVGEDWRRQQSRVAEYIRSQGYFVVAGEPSRDVLLQHAKVALVERAQESYDAVRTPMDLPIAQEVIAAVQAARGTVYLWPTMGGSVPLAAMERATGARTITVPIANHDDNQHTFDENLRLENLWNGIETMAALMEIK